ncbi:hypothetical protein VBD025_15875 [Virgibacillus flavescens]|uniref:hypothetical protein n=1 Tax=Virgibacillus flavescens TaxID=1611422 RepID=UPI003D337377
MEIDFSPLKETMNGMAIDLLIILGIPFIAALLIGYVLKFFRLPTGLIQNTAVVVFLLGLYQMFMIKY